MFELFDRTQEYSVRWGKLPHWFQSGVTYFVTFRTCDSVPQKLMQDWRIRRNNWLTQHGIDPLADDWKSTLRSDPTLEATFNRIFQRQFMEYLDRGFGSCPMRDSAVAQLVANSLRYFDGKRYWLSDFVIMPNHVHLIVGMIHPHEIEKQCRSWKTFSARMINQYLNRNGRLWQEESFDHLIRTPEHFDYFQRYISENPRKANLLDGEFLLWARSDVDATTA